VDLTKPRSELFFRIDGQSNAGTAALVLTPRCPVDQLWKPEFISVQNATGESLTTQFVLVTSSSTILVSANSTPGDGTAVGTNQLPLVGPGEAIGVQVTGTANKAAVHLVVTGWIYHERQEWSGPPPAYVHPAT